MVIIKEGGKMKLPTSIENILNENIVENARLELKKNWNLQESNLKVILIQIL